MSAALRPPRAPALLGVGLASLACVAPADYGARGHYQHPETHAAAPVVRGLLSAKISRFGEEPSPLEERTVEIDEAHGDRIVLVFAAELDPLTVDPRAFGILRADGQRVRPTRAFLGPADEGDENRSLTLVGEFGSEAAPPVAVHVLGNLYMETGEDLMGLDADIVGPQEPDRPVTAERIDPGPGRCPDARQVVRTYWTDVLTQVGDDDLAKIELRLADGRTVAPVGFDDQARRDGEYPCEQPYAACLGPADDNVLDLCVDTDAAVVHLRFGAGLFADEGGRPTAAADLLLD